MKIFQRIDLVCDRIEKFITSEINERKKGMNDFLKIFVRIGLICDRIEKFITGEINDITSNRRGLRE